MAPTMIFNHKTPIRELTSVTQIAILIVAILIGIEITGFMTQPLLEYRENTMPEKTLKQLPITAKKSS
tara:strand:+ start:149 stop:352 length:204 start_codon:yes stop_codon:yes gene_type:complete